VYSADWLTDSVKAGQLLDKSEYFKYLNKGKQVRRMEFNKQVLEYTITETLKVIEIAAANPKSAKGITFWNKKAGEGVIPTRSGDSMLNHFKLIQVRGLDTFLKMLKILTQGIAMPFKKSPRLAKNPKDRLPL
jgi:hypothetical protein